MARCDLVMIVYVPDSLGLDKTVDLGVFGDEWGSIIDEDGYCTSLNLSSN